MHSLSSAVSVSILCCRSCHGHFSKQKQTLFLLCRYVIPKNSHHHLQLSSSLFRRRRTSKTFPKSSSSPEQKLEMVIDLDDISNRASTSLQRFYRSSRSRFHEFLSSGAETLADLQTLVTFDRKGRMVVSCHRSSLEFLASFFIWSFVAVFTIRTLVKFGLGSGFCSWDLVRRRDRSLGGREVVVGRRFNEWSGARALPNPLSHVGRTESRSQKRVSGKRDVTKQDTLPVWWPNSVTSPLRSTEESQRQANRLIRAMMDNRMSGKDLAEDDIIQLRRICRTSGVKMSIDTANTRDSLYRASVEFVLNNCTNTTCQSTLVCIDGEEPRQFVAGFADNIGIQDTRAARIVSAAVAARTRSCFLQAWALEIQGKRSEALAELLRICLIHQIFPPEEHSPEMEMVARGLEKHLKLVQREHLLKLFQEVCGAENQRSAMEALGLCSPSEESGSFLGSQ